jgi:hypothetical protein
MILGLIVFAGALIGGAFVVILDVELIQRRRKKKEELQSSLSRSSSAREKR